MPGLTEEQKREEKEKKEKAKAVAGRNDELQLDLLEEEVLQQADKLAEAQNASGGKQVTRDEIRNQIQSKDRPRDQNLEKWIDDILKKLQMLLEEIREWRRTPKSKKPVGPKATYKAIAKDTWEQVKDQVMDEGIVDGVLGSLSGGGFLGIAIGAVGNVARDTASMAVDKGWDLTKKGALKAGAGLSTGAKALWEKVSGTSKEVDDQIKKHSQDFDDAPEAKAGSLKIQLDEHGKMTHFEVRDTELKEMGTTEQQDQAAKFADYVESKTDYKVERDGDGFKLVNNDGNPIGSENLEELADDYKQSSGLDVEIEPDKPAAGFGL